MQRVALAALMTVLGAGLRPLCAGINAWTSVGPDVGMIVSLAVDPQAPGTVYAVTGSSMLFKTTDAGARWTAVSSGLGGLLAIDPQNPSTMYLGGGTYWGGDGIFKSTDRWNKLECGELRAATSRPFSRSQRWWWNL